MCETDMTDYDLLKQLVEGEYDDRQLALAELHRRTVKETIDRHIYRVKGAVACYDLKECSNLELREVVRWCVQRFDLAVVQWWDDTDDVDTELVEAGGEG